MRRESVVSGPETDGAGKERTRADGPPAVSVLVPVCGEADPLDQLYHDHAETLREAGRDFEFVFAVEPYHGRLIEPLLELRDRGEPIQVLRVGQNVGEAVLVSLASERSTAPVLVTLPAFRRVDASVLPHLVDIVESGGGLASARRWPRRDPWLNRLQGRMLNTLVEGLGGGRLQDVTCGVTAFRREVLQTVPLYGDFFRFFPLLAHREGYRVQEMAAEQHPRDARTRLHHPGVYARRLLDILGLFFLLRFTEKPLRFFGLVGSGTSLAGAIILLVILAQRVAGQPVADRPLMLLGVLLVVLGVQAIALGLVGEIIVHLHAGDRRAYRTRAEGDARPTTTDRDVLPPRGRPAPTGPASGAGTGPMVSAAGSPAASDLRGAVEPVRGPDRPARPAGPDPRPRGNDRTRRNPSVPGDGT